MVEPVKLTPEQEAVQEEVKKLGLVEGTTVIGEAEEAIPAVPAVPAVPAPPAVPAAPAAAVPATPAEPLAPGGRTLKEWAEAEQARANTERGRAEGLEAENKRLRLALGTPTGPAPAEADVNARKWVLDLLTSGGLLAEAIEKLPEDALDKHPTIRKRDMAIYMTRDEIAQTQFLGRFEPKQRPVVQKRVLPILRQQRQSSGFQDNYDDLYDKYAQGIKEQAELVGLVVTEPGAAPVVPAAPPAAPGAIPPSLSGVRGGGSPGTPSAEPLSVEDARVLGLA